MIPQRQRLHNEYIMSTTTGNTTVSTRLTDKMAALALAANVSKKKPANVPCCELCSKKLSATLVARDEPMCAYCERAIATFMARRNPIFKGKCGYTSLPKDGSAPCKDNVCRLTAKEHGWCKVHGPNDGKPSKLEEHMNEHMLAIVAFTMPDDSDSEATSNISV